jgi:hypothetical protein
MVAVEEGEVVVAGAEEAAVDSAVGAVGCRGLRHQRAGRHRLAAERGQVAVPRGQRVVLRAQPAESVPAVRGPAALAVQDRSRGRHLR